MTTQASGLDMIVRLKVELDDASPTIWRRIELPSTATLRQLHDAIQAAMLFEDYHLFEFRIAFEDDERRYAIPDPDDDLYGIRTYDARNLRIGAIPDRGVQTFKYVYDFGDNWRHTVTIESIDRADAKYEYPRFVEGERRAPPEDVGGVPGFEEFLEAMEQKRHPERKRMIDWYGKPFDASDLGLEEVRQRFAKLARRRALGKAAGLKARGASEVD
jgi:hypothetical protein